MPEKNEVMWIGRYWSGSRQVCAALIAAIALTSMLSGFTQEPGLLMWQRDAIAAGDYWRLLSAHAVHLSPAHLLMNVLGLWLITELLCEQLSAAEFLSLFFCSALGVALLLWCLQPQLRWYAGLSGVLHGLWSGSATLNWLREKNRIDLFALLVLAFKLAGVALYPLIPLTADIPVVVEAHWYGALSGLLWVLLQVACRRRLWRVHQRFAVFD